MEKAVNTTSHNKVFVVDLLFWLFVVLLLTEKALVFFNLSTVYIDSDQPFMWIGAHDYSKGIFMEPRFYGQDYNTFMEGLFAVPFMWLSIPVYYALPLATHFIFLFTVLFPAFYLFLNNKKENALLVLAVFLCLPFAFDIMTGIPRGLITGLFFTSFYIINVLRPTALKFIVLNALMSLVGYFVNPNLVIVAVPFFFYVFLHNYSNLKFYVSMLLCLLLFFPLDYFFNGFYTRHPSYVVYGLEYAVSPRYFWKTFSKPNEIFGHVSFFMVDNCSGLMLALGILGWALYKTEKKAFYTLLFFVAFVLFAFCMSKTWDGTTWPFYSFSRMYLGIPFVIFLFAALVSIRINRFAYAFGVVCIAFASYKMLRMKKDISSYTDMSRWAFVRLSTLDKAIESMNFFKGFCKKNQVDHLFLSTAYYMNTYITYGGPAIFPDYPKTQEADSERRYWVVEENRNKVIPRFIFISSSYTLHERIDTTNFNMERLDNYGLYLIKNNTLTTDSFFSLSTLGEK